MAQPSTFGGDEGGVTSGLAPSLAGGCSMTCLSWEHVVANMVTKTCGGLRQLLGNFHTYQTGERRSPCSWVALVLLVLTASENTTLGLGAFSTTLAARMLPESAVRMCRTFLCPGAHRCRALSQDLDKASKANMTCWTCGLTKEGDVLHISYVDPRLPLQERARVLLKLLGGGMGYSRMWGWGHVQLHRN